MDIRYDLKLPEFLRVIWASDQAREVWEPRIRRISNAWSAIERYAVAEHAKPAALQVCSPDELPGISAWAFGNGLVCVPLGRQASIQGYANETQAVIEGKPWGYRYLICRQSLAKTFIEAWKELDNEKIGAALGFPSCCRHFFQKYWGEEGWRDLTFPMVMGEVNATDINVHGSPVECNILLRWLGVRLVSHLPCSFYCQATQKIGQRVASIGVQYGYVEEMGWLLQMLELPVRWTALHGVATITTPLFRVVTNTTATTRKLLIDRDGREYPAEGARGNEFPFKQIHTLTVRRTNDFADNGFGSKYAQEKAHAVVLQAVRTALGQRSEIGESVIDLGCGNGKLLQEIHNVAPWVKLVGVEREETRFRRAARRLLGYDSDIRHADVFDSSHWSGKYRLALISVNRFREVEADVSKRLLRRMQKQCQQVIFYSYAETEWPGLQIEEGCDLFELGQHFGGDNACAVIVTPRVDHDHNLVQAKRQT